MRSLFRPSSSAVIRAIEEGAFKMQSKETDPYYIPDQLLRYVVEDLFRTNEWATYRNDAANFENAFRFLELVLEKILWEQVTQHNVMCNPYYDTYINYRNFTRY